MWKALPQAALLAFIASTSLAAVAPTASRQWDYVIIGGGPAGFVLAEELSKNSSVTVILLEAGPENANVQDIDTPALGPLLLDTVHTWNYSSQPDPNIEGNAPTLAQGRGFGGGSAVNYLGACRGAPSVFDQWADISGDDGLRWENFINDYKAVFPYKEVPLSYDPHVDLSTYGDGPVELTSANDLLGFVMGLIQSWQDVLKLPWTDLNNGTGLGVATGTNVIRANNRTRDFAPQAYGWQMAGRTNAQLNYNAEVTKIIFKGNRATSVNVVNPVNGSTYTVSGKEIIVAGGGINSPRLLMLSGVGPANHLQSLSIPVVANISQIGQNLYDHHAAFMEFEVIEEVQTLWQLTENATFAAIAEQEYHQNASGPLGVPSGFAFASFRVPDAVFEAVNDTFHTSLPPDRGQLLWQYSASTLQATTPNASIISPFVALAQPEASGYMLLASANYQDAPLIYSNYYGSPGDKAAILYGYKLLRQVISDPAISNVLVKEVYPGTNVQTDEELWNAISGGSVSYHHPMGTVALGTVVEGKTNRIKGLEGIRVVDSSVFPYMPTCHPMATVYAYAYHSAQLIKQQDRF